MNDLPPSRILSFTDIPRLNRGVPEVQYAGWFRNHLYWHHGTVISGDNVSFVLHDEPGHKICIINGKRTDTSDLRAPYLSCPSAGTRMETIATVRRHELIFQYRPGALQMTGYPFPRRKIVINTYFQTLLERFFAVTDEPGAAGAADRVDLLGMAFLTEALIGGEGERRENAGIDPRILQLASQIIAHPERDIHIEEAAKSLGFSRISFYRAWRKYSEIPPYRMLTDARLKKAAAMLVMNAGSVKETAAECGFKSPDVFSQTFSARYGVSPGKYRAAAGGQIPYGSDEEAGAHG